MKDLKDLATKAASAAMPTKETVKNASATVAETVGKAVLGKGTVEDMQNSNSKPDGIQKGMKGLGKAGIVLAVMITVGLLATGPFGPLIATILAIGAGMATPKIASSLGSKGMEFSEEERRKQRAAQLNKSFLTEKKKELEESAKEKK
jgi:hypothetical protein